MPTIRTLIPTLDSDDTYVKVQADISHRHKRTVLSAVGDDGVYTFLIATAFKRTYDFIIANDIKSYDSSSRDRLIAFIRDGTDSCTDRTTANGDESGTTTRVQHSTATIASLPSRVGKSSTGRKQRKEGEEGK